MAAGKTAYGAGRVRDAMMIGGVVSCKSVAGLRPGKQESKILNLPRAHSEWPRRATFTSLLPSQRSRAGRVVSSEGPTMETPRLGCEPSGGGRISSAPIHRAALISRPRFGKRWGRYRSKRWYGDTIFSSYSCCWVVRPWPGNGLGHSGGFRDQTSTCQPATMLFSGACWQADRQADRQAGRQAGRMDRSEVVWSGLWVGVARRSGTGGARRKYVWLGVAICQRGPDWSKIRGPSGCSAGR
jgi:hypothetical protein